MSDLTIEFAGELLANRLNFDPYFGYGYENHARAFAYWNYLSQNRRIAPFGIRDSEGKRVIYFSALDEQGANRVYKAYRDIHDELHYVNEAVAPDFLVDGERVQAVIGLGTYFIALRLVNAAGVLTRAVLVKTTSSDWSDWKDYVVLDDYQDLSSFYYDHKSGNYIKVWVENEIEVWYCLYDQNFSYLISPTKLMDTSEDAVYDDPDNVLEFHENTKIHGISVTYDRLNEDMIVLLNTTTAVMNTDRGGLGSLGTELTLNFSMAESTLADGQGLVLNNIPYGTDANYNIFRAGMQDNGVCYTTEMASYTFDEYYEGGLIETEYESWPDLGSILCYLVEPGEKIYGCYTSVTEEMVEYFIQDVGMPSTISLGMTKAMYAVGDRLILTGMTGDDEIPTAVSVHTIDGDRLLLDGEHQILYPNTDLGSLFEGGKKFTTAMDGSIPKTYSYRTEGNVSTLEILVVEDDEVKRYMTNIVLPSIPDDFYSYGSWTFDRNLADPTFYFLVTPKMWTGSPKQHTPVVLRWNKNDPDVGWGAGWKKFNTELDPEGMAESKAGLNSTIAVPTQLSISTSSGGPSIYTDQGHVVFVTEWESYADATKPTVSVFDPATDSLVGSFRTQSSKGPHGIGYHPSLGYYAVESVNEIELTIRAQDLASYEDFWTGAASTTYKILCPRANEASIKILPQPVFVGGRFSDRTTSTDVPLVLNKTNYVYVVRDRETPFDISFEVTDQLLPNSYYRALMAEVVCDAHGPISQKTHKANWKA